MICGPDGKPIINVEGDQERTEFILQALANLISNGIATLVQEYGIAPPRVVQLNVDGMSAHLTSDPEVAEKIRAQVTPKEEPKSVLKFPGGKDA